MSEGPLKAVIVVVCFRPGAASAFEDVILPESLLPLLGILGVVADTLACEVLNVIIIENYHYGVVRGGCRSWHCSNHSRSRRNHMRRDNVNLRDVLSLPILIARRVDRRRRVSHHVRIILFRLAFPRTSGRRVAAIQLIRSNRRLAKLCRTLGIPGRSPQRRSFRRLRVDGRIIIERSLLREVPWRLIRLS